MSQYNRSKEYSPRIEQSFAKESDTFNPFKPKAFTKTKTKDLPLIDCINPNIFISQESAWKIYTRELDQL